ncbi:transglycosylase domain-containing protein [Cellulomonas oligotrophica]|uniref:Carboxypeptidase n=2 Tax=Cellulomonas oligotrophica TaxID=931536 RepID=A0ABQ4D6K9_9CELL|nr:carboxypeptidase [Cellulomonas oligotrophica]
MRGVRRPWDEAGGACTLAGMPTPARARGRKVNAFQALALLLSFVMVAGVGGVLGAGLVLPGVAAANTVTDVSVTAFNDLPTELEQRALPEKSEILAADGTLLATFYQQNRVVVPLEDIAEIMQKAVIAVEDRRFYEHAGVDVAGMTRAAIATAMGTTQGASTLTQQYVKNVLIEAANYAETEEERLALVDAAREAEGAEGIARKLREAKIAISLEQEMTKDEILEKYLNIAAFGASVYGVESAAQYYFGKSAKDVTYLEAATIAGITQSPSKWDPALDPEANQLRRNVVLKDMRELGYITQEEYETGVDTPVEETLKVTPIKLGCMAAGDVVPGSGFFCDYVTKVIAQDPAFGETRQERSDLLYRGGLTITTTLIPSEQAVADAEVKAGVPVDDPSGVASAIVSVEPGNGKITAMAQNRNYSALQETADRETAVNFNTSFEYGGSTGFSPGSTFKPFTLLEWLRKGHALNETVNGSRLSYQQNEFPTCINLVGDWNFGNSEGGRATTQTVLDATKNSVNSAYAAMAKELNLCDIMNGATDLGVTQAGDPNKLDRFGNPANSGFNPTPANVLGSESTSPLQMAAAYATFASGGTYCKPIAITSVIDPTGTELPVPSADCRAGAVEPQIAAAINYALSNVWTGTASRVGAPSFPAAGKTGTTSVNENNWFLGYTPKRATAVWVGYSGAPRPMGGQVIAGVPYFSGGPYGSSIAAPTWKRYMERVLGGGDNPGFAAAGEREIYGERVSVPYVLGMSESQARSRLEAAGFRVSIAPQPVESQYQAGSVAQQSPSSQAVRGSSITLTLSSGQPQQPAPGDGETGSPGRGDENSNNPQPGNP